MKERIKSRDIITIGFALFAMFFGAGNLLIPPYIGITSGSNYLITILSFTLTAILLPLLGILSVVYSGNNFTDLCKRIHPYLAPFLGSIIMICIGPLIGVPRTAATTFEIGIKPLFNNFNLLYSLLIFFLLVYFLSIKPSRIVDLMGNYLTPLLLIILTILIILGFLKTDFSLIKSFNKSKLESFFSGFIEGYQTLDVLGAIIFADMIIKSSENKGYNNLKHKIVIYSGIISTICLFFVYGGLIYLGAYSGIYDSSISRSDLLLMISHKILGQKGLLYIYLCIIFACLTTAIAIVTSVGLFFYKLFNQRIRYNYIVLLVCILSFIISINGVDNIIHISYIPLAFVYPITITLVIFTLIFRKYVKIKIPYIVAIIVSSISSLIYLLRNFINEKFLNFFKLIMPFFDYEFGWVIPTFISFIITNYICIKFNKATNN